MLARGEKVQKNSQRLGRQVQDQPIITDNQRRRGRPLNFKPSSDFLYSNLVSLSIFVFPIRALYLYRLLLVGIRSLIYII